MKDIRKVLFFDIETAGKAKEVNNSESIKKKSIKIKGDSSKVSRNFIESIYAEYGRVVCVSYGCVGVSGEYKIESVNSEDERELIERVNEVFKRSEDMGYVLGGWNIKGFDIPWIYKKVMMYGMKPAGGLKVYGKKPWEVECLDLKEVWKGCGSLESTFDECCVSMGVESSKSEMDGSKVHEAYWGGNADGVRRYCEEDVRASIDLYKRFVELLG